MKSTVEEAVKGLRVTFPSGEVFVQETPDGGAYVRVEPIELGPKFRPERTWIAGHIPPQCPYADVYPLFIGGDVTRADGKPWVAPVTPCANFMGRPALQISRRTNRLDPNVQTVALKFQKVLHWLQHLA